MTLSPENPALEALLHDIKQVEMRLDAATLSVESFSKEHPGSCPTSDPILARIYQNEENQAQKWATTFDTIINYQPRSFEDLQSKTLALLEYLDMGHNDPNILKMIKSDLKAFSSTAAIPHAYLGSSRRRQA